LPIPAKSAIKAARHGKSANQREVHIMKKASQKKAVKTAKKLAEKKAPKKPAQASKKTQPKTAKAVKKSAKKKVVKKAAKKKPAKKAPAIKRPAKKVAKKPVKKAAPRKKAIAPPAPPPELPEGARAAPIPEPANVTPGSPSEVLLALAKVLLDDEQYHDDVRLAAEAPHEYVDKFSDALSDRGLDAPTPHLPWIALTDGLSERDALVQLDWKFEPSDLSEAMTTLLRRRTEAVDLTALPGYGESTEGLQSVGDRLLAAGLALVTVGNKEVEDAFPIAVLENEKVPEAQRLASALGLGSIQRWSSEDAIA
jgi:hypothetical protein